MTRGRGQRTTRGMGRVAQPQAREKGREIKARESRHGQRRGWQVKGRERGAFRQIGGDGGISTNVATL